MKQHQPLSTQEWLEIDRRALAPVFMARPAWSLAWADTFPEYEPYPVRRVLSDGTTAYIPLLRGRSRAGWKVCYGMPWGAYTTCLREDGSEASPQAALEVIRSVARDECDALELTLWPLGALGGLSLPGRRTACELAAIDLADGVDAALARMDGKARRMAGQAERRGVSCARAEGAAALDAYYGMLEASARRWGIAAPTIPKTLLDNVVRRGGGDVEIWFAYFEGAPIAGGIALFGSHELTFWTAALLAEYGTLRPSNALNVALMRRAAERGVRWYNLCSSSGLAGVERFKQTLGARSVEYATWHHERGLYATYRRLRSIFERSSARGNPV